MASIVCVECSRPAVASAKRWQAHLADLHDDGQDEIVFYCPACADREFGTFDERGLDEISG